MKDKIIEAIKDRLLGEFVGDKKVIDVSVSIEEEIFEGVNCVNCADTIKVKLMLEGKDKWISAFDL